MPSFYVSDETKYFFTDLFNASVAKDAHMMRLLYNTSHRTENRTTTLDWMQGPPEARYFSRRKEVFPEALKDFRLNRKPDSLQEIYSTFLIIGLKVLSNCYRKTFVHSGLGCFVQLLNKNKIYFLILLFLFHNHVNCFMGFKGTVPYNFHILVSSLKHSKN